jgi:glycerol-3-phosphate dehydrogenase
MALGEEAVAMLASIGLAVHSRADRPPATIRMTPLGEREARPYLEGGTIVCHCERVTADEITAACSASVPATDFDGLRRRTRALTGRCQGFYCMAAVCRLAAMTSGRSSDEWLSLT